MKMIGRMGKAWKVLKGATEKQVPVGVGDFTPMFWAGRRMTPEQVRFTLESAIGGNLQQQWALFDLMEDTWPRLLKNLNEVRRAAVRSGYRVQPYAERGKKATPDAEARAQLVEAAIKNWRPQPGTLELSFEDSLFNALDALGKGLSVLEITWQQLDDGILPRCGHLLPATRYGWSSGGTELGLIDSHHHERGVAARTVWQPFPEGQFWIGAWHARSGPAGQTALLRCLAPYWCGITFGWEWLLNNAQIFGVPFRWATYDAARPELLGTLSGMLENLGQAGWAAFPEGTSMDFKEAVQRAADNPQVFIQQLADKYCDQLILGQEASSESKPAGIGSGAADLHQGVRGERLKDAAQWCADLLNYQMVPALLRWNFGDEDEPPTILSDIGTETDAKSMADRDEVLSRITPLPKKWFFERHSIPEPEDGEETVGGPAGAQSPMDFSGFSGRFVAPGGAKVAAGTPNPSARRGERPSSASGDRGATLPGAYELPDAAKSSLLSAHDRDLAPIRAAAGPLLAAIESGQLEVVGELENFIARLDALAPQVIGAGDLADALEAALAEAAISGAAAAFEHPKAKES